MLALFTWLISHQPAVLFSQNKSANTNQSTILFSQKKSVSVTSHQPNELAVGGGQRGPPAMLILLLFSTLVTLFVWLVADAGLF
jgi:hypothetical protein